MPALSTDVLEAPPNHVVTYSNQGTPIAVATGAPADVAIASPNLNSFTNAPKAFTFVNTTGTLTLNCSGFYEVHVNALCDASAISPTFQTMKLFVGATGALTQPQDLATFRQEVVTATQKSNLKIHGLTPYLTESTIMQVIFTSSAGGDTVNVYAFHWFVRRIAGVPGTAS